MKKKTGRFDTWYKIKKAMECANPGPKPIGHVYLHCLSRKVKHFILNNKKWT